MIFKSFIKEGAMRLTNNTTLGLLAVVGIWITAGISLPMVNVIDNLSPGQLLVVRGFLTASIAFVFLRGDIGGVGKFTTLIAVCVPFASVGLFMGIREWGAGPTIVIITATPTINFLAAWAAKHKVNTTAKVCLIALVGGVAISQWHGGFNLAGFLWSLMGTIANGVVYEFLARAKSDPPLKKCFWGSVGMGVGGLLLSFNHSWVSALENPDTIKLLLFFAFTGGFLYWLSNLEAFTRLPKVEVSVLAQGETLFVIIGSALILDEKFTPIQWLGVAIALLGAGYLSYWLSKESK